MQQQHLFTAFTAAGLLLCVGCSSAEQATPASIGAMAEDDAPARSISVVTEPRIGIPGEPIQFSVVSPDGEPVWFYWQFGDSTFSHEAAPTHAYAGPHVYEANLAVVVSEDTVRQAFLVEVEPDWCPEVVELNSIAFARNRNSISDTDHPSQHAMAMLAENLDLLKTCPSLQVTVVGAASERERMPLILARERAEALVQYYVDAGLNPDRFRAEGQPQPAGRSRNAAPPHTSSQISGSQR